MNFTALLSKFIGKVYLGEFSQLLFGSSFVSVMSSINEYIWSKCVSPKLSLTF